MMATNRGDALPTRLREGNAISLIKNLVFILVCGSLFPGCAAVDPVVKIGLVAPFEGEHRAVGYDVIYSARLAVREINHQGGIGGYRVALVALDDSGDPSLAVETAASLVLDPAVVAVMGHWQPDTTAAANPIYHQAGLFFIPMGENAFGVQNPQAYPAEFREAYAAVTPFEEEAGPFAGSTYDVFQIIWAEMNTAVLNSGKINRKAMQQTLSQSEYIGMTGNRYQLPSANGDG
jgi:ABC-type branched-subunit amino acid transport system substrate-binding protein